MERRLSCLFDLECTKGLLQYIIYLLGHGQHDNRIQDEVPMGILFANDVLFIIQTRKQVYDKLHLWIKALSEMVENYKIKLRIY